MKLTSTIILSVLTGSLVLLGCGEDNPTLPDVLYAEGFVHAGWDAYMDNDFETAMEYFLQAIDAAVDWPDGYLGAGWTSIHLSDYWILGEDFFYMASQLDGGSCPLVQRSESQTQDTMWTVFECVDPALTAEDMQVIGSLGDSLYFPDLDTTFLVTEVLIGNYLYGASPFNVDPYPQYGDIPFIYRFQPLHDDCIAMFDLENGFTNELEYVDSVVVEGGEAWVYITAPYVDVVITSTHYRTWIAADNSLVYDYETYTPAAGMTQITCDALAGWACLEEVRCENGDPLTNNGAVWGLYSGTGTYDFGAGEYWDSAEDLSEVQLKGVAASTAFFAQAFRFAWFSCTSVGYGLSLDPDNPGFVFALLQVIETML
jgi:hypothetical protein